MTRRSSCIAVATLCCLLVLVGSASAESWIVWEHVETALLAKGNVSNTERWTIKRTFGTKPPCDEELAKNFLVAALLVAKKKTEPTPNLEYALRDDE